MAKLEQWELMERDLDNRIKEIANSMHEHAEGIYQRTWGYRVPAYKNFEWRALGRATDSEQAEFHRQCQAAKAEIEESYRLEINAANQKPTFKRNLVTDLHVHCDYCKCELPFFKTALFYMPTSRVFCSPACAAQYFGLALANDTTKKMLNAKATGRTAVL